MLGTPFSPWPAYTEEEISAVSEVLRSNRVNYWTGSEGRSFENEFARFCGVNHAVALANGTVALDAALYALDIGAGDEVIVTSRTFLASVTAIVNRGATPVFADIETASQNISAATVKPLITPDTRAVICVHLAGWPCDMDGIMALAEKHDLKVIEDCAQAHGARYKGTAVGGIGHIGAWSFCQDKIMTTGGEGGMVTTNDPGLWSKIWSYKDHGKSWDAVYNMAHPPGFRWLHESFGTNYRLTEMQSAIGRIQLKHMANWHAIRTRHANEILSACEQFPEIFYCPRPPDEIEHAWYKCYVFIRPDGLSDDWDRDKIMHEINMLGVPCYSGSCSEVYLERAFDNTDFRPEQPLPGAKKLGETSLMFLVHPTLTASEISETRDVISLVAKQAMESG